jgi:hypothetical protein
MESPIADAGHRRWSLKWYVAGVLGFEQKVKPRSPSASAGQMDPVFGGVLIPTETVQDNQGARVSEDFTPATLCRWP